MTAIMETPGRFKGLSLADCVRSLPQELSDHIEEEVFSCVSTTQHVVKHPQRRLHRPMYLCKLKAPDTTSLLYVSKTTRTKFIKSYYQDATVILPHDLETMVSWTERLRSANRQAIREVVVVMDEKYHNQTRSFLLNVRFRGWKAGVRLVQEGKLEEIWAG